MQQKYIEKKRMVYIYKERSNGPQVSVFFSMGAKCSDGKLEMPISKNSTVYSKSRDLEELFASVFRFEALPALFAIVFSTG